MNNRKEIIIASVYTTMMSIAMIVAYRWFGYSYSDPRIVRVLFYFEIVMTIFTLVIYFLYYPLPFSFGKLRVNMFFIFYVTLFVIATVLFLKDKYFLDNNNIVYLVITTNILVGLSEELMYRGVILQGFLINNSKVKAVIMSSILFSLLHVVNLFAAISFHDLLIQLINTFIYGVFASCLALKIGTILPFIITHGMWDNFVNSQRFVEKYSLLFLIFIVFEIVVGFILFIRIVKEEKVKSNKDFASLY